MNTRFSVIDSGLGGLSVYQKLIKRVDSCVYIADNKYFPYGLKEDKILVKIIERLMAYSLNNGFDKIILACNTASMIYDKYLKDIYNDTVISIIESTVNSLKGLKGLCHVGVIATEQVIKSGVYETLIKEKFDVRVTVVSSSPLVELCEHNNREDMLQYFDAEFKVFGAIDTLILGCTHFNLVANEIRKYFNDQVNIVSSGLGIIDSLVIDNVCPKNHVIYLTRYEKSYAKKIKNLFKELKNIKIQELNI